LEQGGLMSSIISKSNDRVSEAIHLAQQAHEPSMDEILASIRNLIADDPAKGLALKAPPTAPSPMPQIVSSRDTQAPYADASGPPQPIADPSGPAVVWRRPQAVEAEPADAADAVQRSGEPLLSAEAGEAVALSFGALSANLEVRSAELADSMVRDMLRPMVKAWLDDNLPPMVEKLVREEIQRVARGRK
jgi:uncharacterized protein